MNRTQRVGSLDCEPARGAMKEELCGQGKVGYGLRPCAPNLSVSS
jgi:hypothetical protein